MQKQHQQQQTAGGPGPGFFLRFMRVILIILNIGVLVMGIISLAIGIWSLSDEYGADNIEEIMDTRLFTAASIILIVGGIFVILTAVLGGLGAFFRNQIMLGIYFGIMVFFCLTYIVGFIVVFFFSDEVEDSLAKSMTSTLQSNYEVNTANNEQNDEITIIWNDIQRKLHCCGVRGELSSTESWFLWQSSQWFATEGQAPLASNTLHVPSSCCNSDNYLLTQCQRQNADSTKPPQTSVAGITQENPALYSQGCLDALKDEINKHIVAMTVVAALVFILIIACGIFAILVCLDAGSVSKVL